MDGGELRWREVAATVSLSIWRELEEGRRRALSRSGVDVWMDWKKKGGKGWMQNDHEDRARVGVEGLMTAVGSSSIRRCIIHDPHAMPMEQSECSKQFEDFMTI